LFDTTGSVRDALVVLPGRPPGTPEDAVEAIFFLQDAHEARGYVQIFRPEHLVSVTRASDELVIDLSRGVTTINNLSTAAMARMVIASFLASALSDPTIERVTIMVTSSPQAFCRLLERVEDCNPFTREDLVALT